MERPHRTSSSATTRPTRPKRRAGHPGRSATKGRRDHRPGHGRQHPRRRPGRATPAGAAARPGRHGRDHRQERVLPVDLPHRAERPAGMKASWKQIVSKAKKVGVFYQEDAYGKFGAEFAQKSGDPRLHDRRDGRRSLHRDRPHPPGDEFRNAGAEAVFMQLSVTSLGASFLKAVNEVGLKAPPYANSGLAQGSSDAAGRSGRRRAGAVDRQRRLRPHRAEQKLWPYCPSRPARCRRAGATWWQPTG